MSDSPPDAHAKHRARASREVVNNGTLDRISLKQILSEFEIKRTALYDRLNALEIKPEKTAKGSYLSADQLELFQELHLFILSGGKIADFVAQRTTGELPANNSEALVREHSDQPRLLPGATSSPIIQVLPPPPDPIIEAATRRRILREAAEYGEVLPTSELLALLQLASLPRGAGERFKRRGFVFMRVRKGREGEWRVSRG